MRIGILTLYDYLNCGAFLQAYALQRVLNSMGHQARFINIDSWGNRWLKFKKYVRSNNPKKILFNLHRLKKYQQAAKVLGEPIKLTSVRHECDAVVIGSDELWNVRNRSFINHPTFFGVGLDVNKIVAYAPSCGRAVFEDMLKYPFINQGLKKITNISVRDSQTAMLVEHILSIKPTLVLDPTLLHVWEEVQPADSCDPYLLVYDYGDSFNNSQVELIKDYAKQKCMKIFSANFFLPWCDKSFATSPFEFLSLMAGAKGVITGTFHGTIFSIIYKKPFITVKGNPKVYDLINQLELTSRLKESLNRTTIHELFEKKIDWDFVSKILVDKKRISIQYLSESLEKF